MSKARLVLIAAAGILLASQVSWAAAVVVGHCKSGLVSFTTIQDAVNHSSPGGTIYVCPGTYPEQVEITQNLILIGVQGGTQYAPVVASPAAGLAQNAPNFAGGNPIAAQIWVHNVATGVVNISNLTVDAANNNIYCSPSPVGILYQNAAGTVAHVVTRNQVTSPDSIGCQSGYGILVQSTGAVSSVLNVNNSTVHNFQKNGIVGQQTGATLNAMGNTVLGQGPTTGAAENGIEIAFGAAGKITGNSVSDFIYSPGTAGASGILLYDSGGVTISGNTVANSQYGIAIAETTAGKADTNTVTGNKVYGTHIFDGIDVCSSGNTVKSNTVNTSDESGIHNDSTCTSGNNGNIITNNTINEACAGLLTGETPNSNTLSPNTFFNVNNTVVAGDTCTTTVFTPNFGLVNLKAGSKFVP